MQAWEKGLGKCEKVELVAVGVRESSRKGVEQVGRAVGELVGRLALTDACP